MSAKLYLILNFIFLLTISYGQERLALYEGEIPNSRPIPGLSDSTVYRDFLDTKIPFVVRVVKPDLSIHLADKNQNTGIAVIICPGGGYSGLANGHEGEEMAKRFQEAGITGIVLNYRLPNYLYVDNKSIVPLQDAQRAIQIVRQNAKKWNIDPDKIGILGSSAGGHLASTAGTHYQETHIDNPDKISLRPDFMVLNYPVISFADSLTHHGSRYNLIGPDAPMPGDVASVSVPQKQVLHYSNELHVDSNTPPTFLTHAVDDGAVNIQNSILFMAALQQHEIPVEAFFYTKGGHGYGMYNPTAKVDWMESCIRWVKVLFYN